MLRYLVVVFPIAIILARISRRPTTDLVLTIVLALALALAQGALLMLWTACQAYWVV